MQESITKIPGKFDTIDIRCPKCNSSQITILQEKSGYFKVTECYKCGYKDKD